MLDLVANCKDFYLSSTGCLKKYCVANYHRAYCNINNVTLLDIIYIFSSVVCKVSTPCQR